jgi:hypothetical protein
MPVGLANHGLGVRLLKVVKKGVEFRESRQRVSDLLCLLSSLSMLLFARVAAVVQLAVS